MAWLARGLSVTISGVRLATSFGASFPAPDASRAISPRPARRLRRRVFAMPFRLIGRMGTLNLSHDREAYILR